ncbi:hypothetical protein H5410_061069 [Solanum commersonii]|uniref:Uncharacterized protein n=1 Tax=Solanum commersonii TaxID=4109 RepID=A0A9J5W7I7_SOLCO|nr:hypothetical protein H5410_061069 [Solanum commersonii]
MRKHLEPVRKRKKERVYLRAQRPEWANVPLLVDPPPGHDRAQASLHRMMHNRLVLGWHYGAADEAKLEPGGDVHVPLLNGSSCIHPPRGGVKNHRSQPTLQIIQGLKNRHPS